MAAIGLQYCVYAPLIEDEEAGTYSYGPGKRGRKMIKADFKPNYANDPLYADDSVSENSREFIDGTLTINQDELTDIMMVDLLGNTKKTVTIGESSVEEVTSNADNMPPYVGFGYIQSLIVDNVRKYRAIWYHKVQFSEPDESSETKGQRIAWQTPVIVGTIMKDMNGDWRTKATASDLSTAIAWLKQKANIA